MLKRLISLTVVGVFCLNQLCFGFSPVVATALPNPTLLGINLSGRDAINRVSTGISFNLNIPKNTILTKDQRTTLQTNINYFLTALTVDDSEFWVNLNPKEPNRMIGSNLAYTDMGKHLLLLDLKLKKDTAFALFPGLSQGATTYWERVFTKAKELQNKSVGAIPRNRPDTGRKHGFAPTNQLNIPTTFRVWIVPDKAEIYESEGSCVITKSTLKVMLESEYNKQTNPVETLQCNVSTTPEQQLQQYCEQQLKELIIPVLNNKVNTDPTYEPLRQIYNAIILAKWYKQKVGADLRVRPNNNIGQTHRSVPTDSFSSLINTNNLNGLISKDILYPEQVFAAYLDSVRQGEYHLSKTSYNKELKSNIRRSYVSGGVNATAVAITPASGLAGKIALTATANDLSVTVGLTQIPHHIDEETPEQPQSRERLQRASIRAGKIITIPDHLMASPRVEKYTDDYYDREEHWRAQSNQSEEDLERAQELYKRVKPRLDKVRDKALVKQVLQQSENAQHIRRAIKYYGYTYDELIDMLLYVDYKFEENSWTAGGAYFHMGRDGIIWAGELSFMTTELTDQEIIITLLEEQLHELSNLQPDDQHVVNPNAGDIELKEAYRQADAGKIWHRYFNRLHRAAEHAQQNASLNDSNASDQGGAGRQPIGKRDLDRIVSSLNGRGTSAHLTQVPEYLDSISAALENNPGLIISQDDLETIISNLEQLGVMRHDNFQEAISNFIAWFMIRNPKIGEAFVTSLSERGEFQNRIAREARRLRDEIISRQNVGTAPPPVAPPAGATPELTRETCLEILTQLASGRTDIAAAARNRLRAIGRQQFLPYLSEFLFNDTPESRHAMLLAIHELFDLNGLVQLTAGLEQEFDISIPRSQEGYPNITSLAQRLRELDTNIATQERVRDLVSSVLTPEGIVEWRSVLQTRFDSLLAQAAQTQDISPLEALYGRILEMRQKPNIGLRITEDNISPLLNTRLSDTNVNIRAATARFLGNLGRPTVVIGALQTRLDDSQTAVKLASIEALGKLKDKGCVTRLMNFLEQERFAETSVRVAAANALGEIGDNQALGILRNVSGINETPELTRACNEAIARLESQRPATPPPAAQQQLDAIINELKEMQAVEAEHRQDYYDALSAIAGHNSSLTVSLPDFQQLIETGIQFTFGTERCLTSFIRAMAWLAARQAQLNNYICHTLRNHTDEYHRQIASNIITERGRIESMLSSAPAAPVAPPAGAAAAPSEAETETNPDTLVAQLLNPMSPTGISQEELNLIVHTLIEMPLESDIQRRKNYYNALSEALRYNPNLSMAPTLFSVLIDREIEATSNDQSCRQSFIRAMAWCINNNGTPCRAHLTDGIIMGSTNEALVSLARSIIDETVRLRQHFASPRAAPAPAQPGAPPAPATAPRLMRLPTVGQDLTSVVGRLDRSNMNAPYPAAERINQATQASQVSQADFENVLFPLIGMNAMWDYDNVILFLNAMKKALELNSRIGINSDDFLYLIRNYISRLSNQQIRLLYCEIISLLIRRSPIDYIANLDRLLDVYVYGNFSDDREKIAQLREAIAPLRNLPAPATQQQHFEQLLSAVVSGYNRDNAVGLLRFFDGLNDFPISQQQFEQIAQLLIATRDPAFMGIMIAVVPMPSNQRLSLDSNTITNITTHCNINLQEDTLFTRTLDILANRIGASSPPPAGAEATADNTEECQELQRTLDAWYNTISDYPANPLGRPSDFLQPERILPMYIRLSPAGKRYMLDGLRRMRERFARGYGLSPFVPVVDRLLSHLQPPAPASAAETPAPATTTPQQILDLFSRLNVFIDGHRVNDISGEDIHALDRIFYNNTLSYEIYLYAVFLFVDIRRQRVENDSDPQAIIDGLVDFSRVIEDTDRNIPEALRAAACDGIKLCASIDYQQTIRHAEQELRRAQDRHNNPAVQRWTTLMRDLRARNLTVQRPTRNAQGQIQLPPRPVTANTRTGGLDEPGAVADMIDQAGGEQQPAATPQQSAQPSQLTPKQEREITEALKELGGIVSKFRKASATLQKFGGAVLPYLLKALVEVESKDPTKRSEEEIQLRARIRALILGIDSSFDFETHIPRLRKELADEALARMSKSPAWQEMAQRAPSPYTLRILEARELPMLSPKAEEIVPVLVAGLESPDNAIRSNSARNLAMVALVGMIKLDRALQLLIENLQTAPNDNVRISAILALKRLDAPEAIEAIKTSTQNYPPDSPIALTAKAAITELEAIRERRAKAAEDKKPPSYPTTPAVIPVALAPKVVSPAAESINKETLPILLESLQQETNASEIGNIIRKIGEIGDASALDALLERFRSDNPGVSLAAKQAILAIGEKDSEQTLKKLRQAQRTEQSDELKIKIGNMILEISMYTGSSGGGQQGGSSSPQTPPDSGTQGRGGFGRIPFPQAAPFNIGSLADAMPEEIVVDLERLGISQERAAGQVPIYEEEILVRTAHEPPKDIILAQAAGVGGIDLSQVQITVIS